MSVRRPLSVLATIALVACYEPHFDDCVVPCASATDCAAGQQCGETGLCSARGLQCAPITAADVPDGAVDSTQSYPDGGAPPVDGPATPDVPLTPCEAGCPGTCDGDVCILDCTAEGSCAELACPSGLPCRVHCGKAACKHLDCSLASSCDIACTGKNSCEDVTCGEGRCDVTCTGDRACKHGVACESSCACDVRCSGHDACDDRSECPFFVCGRLDGGCRADDVVCDRCP